MFEKFLHRPVLSIVLSIMILLLGIIAILKLPIAQFPTIAPPRVMVAFDFPGSSAEVLVKSALIPLEQSLNGVPGMSYIISDATSAGEATIQVVFDMKTDPNTAVMQVKNRVDQVMSKLPKLIQLEGVVVQLVQPSMLMYVNLYSTNKNTDEKFLFNYANINILQEIKRIPGIAQARNLGSRQYAMRLWLNPDRMRAYNVSTEEVMEAIAEQSVIGRPGRIGQSSGKKAQSLEYVLSYKGQFNKPEEYENIIIKANSKGESLLLKDIATVEFDSEFYDIYSNVDGYPSAAMLLKQTNDSNANDVIGSVKKKLQELSKNFPDGMQYKISYDVSNFINASIEKMLHTLVEAFVLVAFVVFIFLGNWRFTLIPILAVPVSLIGTFLFLQMFGLTINLITLFAMVLAIGIVVDNAIVVVEAVEAKMLEKEKISPYRAVQQVLGEITGAIISITLMMMAVFVPLIFMAGPVGILFKNFAITMATAIMLSGFVALTLTPVLSAMLIKWHVHDDSKRLGLVASGLAIFNRWFDGILNHYASIVKYIIPRPIITGIILLVSIVGIVMINKVVPAGFIPNEDQSMIYAIVQTPPGSTLEKTYDSVKQLQNLAKQVDGVDSIASLAGFEILTEGRGSNAASCIINLKEWSQRKDSVHEIIEKLEEKSKNIGAIVEYFEPPAVPGYGAAGGVSFRMLDKTGNFDYQKFDAINKNFMKELRKRKELTGLFTFFAANYPQYELLIDNQKAMQKGVSIGKALDNLDILIGSTYEQGFIRLGQFFKVYVQSLPEFRQLPSDVLNLYVKNDAGEMVPYSSFMALKKTQGPNEITRYNVYNSSSVRAVPAKGYTTGDAISAIREVAQQVLPRGYDVGWEGLSYDEAQRGNEAIYIFIVVVLFAYLVLCAQYESFVIPLAVILSLPPGILGSFLFLKFMGLANDVYSQVGLIMLVGLLGKNAVLIVEFAQQKRVQGMSVLDASIAGAVSRFRPIIMTSFAFIAGLIPLTLATGAGAVANQTIGGSALGGIFLGTVLGVILVPSLYYIFATLVGNRQLVRDEHETPLSESLGYDMHMTKEDEEDA
jgi:hydrophobic/amphiphilic exporter-1 (mainly G- bacteria), HAE1 family